MKLRGELETGQAGSLQCAGYKRLLESAAVQTYHVGITIQ